MRRSTIFLSRDARIEGRRRGTRQQTGGRVGVAEIPERRRRNYLRPVPASCAGDNNPLSDSPIISIIYP